MYWKVRDLESYKLIDANQAIGRTNCLELFSAERWAEFRKDLAMFDRASAVTPKMRDHGYNGSPTHTFFASKLANLVPTSYAGVTALSVVDVLAICAMLAILTLAFGARFGLLFAILFFVNFSDRFYFIGGSMMRYIWMATLAGGIAMLKLGRYRTAAVLMTSSALLNVFPFLFLVGIGFRALWVLIRTRALPRHYRRFVAAAALTGVIGAGLGAGHSDGVHNYGEFFSFIGGHSQKLTSSRTGFRYTLLYRGDKDREILSSRSKPIGYKKLGKQLLKASPFLFGLGAVLVLAGLVLCVRLDDVEACALVGFLLFFVVFGTVEYYYACTPLLLAIFYRRWGEGGGAFIAGLFALMAVVLLLYRETHSLKFCNNTAMSAALLSFLAATLVYLMARLGPLRLRGARFVAAVIAAAVSGPALVAIGYLAFT